MMHIKILVKQEQAKSKMSSQRYIIKIRAEINEIETTKTIQRINETKIKSCFFIRINMIDKSLANLTKWKREKDPN
jgi:hypothetical protein